MRESSKRLWEFVVVVDPRVSTKMLTGILRDGVSVRFKSRDETKMNDLRKFDDRIISTTRNVLSRIRLYYYHPYFSPSFVQRLKRRVKWT